MFEDDDMGERSRPARVSANRRRRVNLWREEEETRSRARPNVRRETWRCSSCGTWARGASCETGICDGCGTAAQD